MRRERGRPVEAAVAARIGIGEGLRAGAEGLAHLVGALAAAGRGDEREEGAVAGFHADQASAAEGGRSVIGDDRLAFGHDLLLRLLLARCAEERFEEAARLIGGAGLLDGDLKLTAAGVDLALVEVLRGEAGIAALELADLLGDRAAFGGRRPGEEAEGAALAADVAVIADETVDLRPLGLHLPGGRAADVAAALQGRQFSLEALALRRLGKGRLTGDQKGRHGDERAEK